jgi:hypothetical protein
MRPFWRRKPKPPPHHPLPGWPAAAEPDSLSDDLRYHLYASLAAVAPRWRTGAHWVMTPEWWDECLRIDSAQPHLRMSMPFAPTVLLGLRVEIRDGGGPPHLEPAEPLPVRTDP